jgi:hypothetical protein
MSLLSAIGVAAGLLILCGLVAMWVVIRRIAQRTGISQVEVYQRAYTLHRNQQPNIVRLLKSPVLFAIALGCGIAGIVTGQYLLVVAVVAVALIRVVVRLFSIRR